MATTEEIMTVRTLISDTERFDYDSDGTFRYRMSDEMLSALIDFRGGKLYGAAADALRSMAANEALIGKVIRTEDLQVDGAKLADALRLLARELEGRQSNEDDNEALEEYAFEIVDFKYPYVNPEDSYFLRGL